MGVIGKRIGKTLPISQAKGRNHNSYTLFMRNKSKTSKQESQESLDSQTPVSDTKDLLVEHRRNN